MSISLVNKTGKELSINVIIKVEDKQVSSAIYHNDGRGYQPTGDSSLVKMDPPGDD